MPTLHMLIGIPGSGKSTYSKKVLIPKYPNAIYIASDKVRDNNPNMLEKDIWPEIYRLASNALKEGKDVIYDATSYNIKSRARFFAKMEERNVINYNKIAYYVTCSPNLCHERVIKRNENPNERFLPPEVVLEYVNKIEAPTLEEGFDKIIEVNNDIKNYDVVLLIGQSNAEGNGKGDSAYIPSTSRSYHLIDKNPYGIHDENGVAILDMVYPVEMVLEPYQDRICNNVRLADLGYAFASEYEKNGMLENNRELLVVRAAYGGTGFSKKQWGVNNILCKRMDDMLSYAMSLGNCNLVAILWHQGEHDAFEQEWLSKEQRYDFYYKNFKEQMEYIRNKYNKNAPIIAGEFVNDWADKNKIACDAVEKATKDVLNELLNAGVASSEGLLSNDQKHGNGDDIHFCREAIYELGKRYFKIYANLKNCK